MQGFAVGTLDRISKADITNADKVTVQYDMVVAEKKKTRRLDNKARETDASKDRYVAFTTTPRGWTWKNIPRDGVLRRATG